MHTEFTADQLREPDIAEAAHILKDCVHFGFCTSVCPTWVLSRDENEAPRGRIDLIRAMLESGAAPDPATVRHIDTCLSCNACMTTCAARVDYRHLVDRARVHIERHYRRGLLDRATRALVAALLPRPRRFRAAIRLATLASPLARLLPARLRTMVELAPKRPPPASAATAAGVYPAQGTLRMRVALLPGCAQQALAPHINDATIRLLTRHGCEVVVAPGMRCCGALTLHMGKEKQALSDARTTIDAWQGARSSGAIDALVVNASGCGSTLKDYGHWLRHDPDYAAAAAALGAMTLDITELMEQLGLRSPVEPVRAAVAYHDACSLRHVQGLTQPPRALLGAAGFRVHDVPEAHFCCGSAGTYNLLQPGYAEALGRRKAAHVESTGATLVAAGNLGCITQISRFTQLPVVHTVELLDWATGGPRPMALDGVELPVAAETESTKTQGAVGVW